MCATDVAARGIHIKRLKYVVNYDFPGNIEQYIHRVGRAGRQDGDVGVAFSLLSRNMGALAPALVSLLKQCGQTIERNLSELASSQIAAVAETLSSNTEGQEVIDDDEERLKASDSSYPSTICN